MICKSCYGIIKEEDYYFFPKRDIIPFGAHPPMAEDFRNGLTICKNCVDNLSKRIIEWKKH